MVEITIVLVAEDTAGAAELVDKAAFYLRKGKFEHSHVDTRASGTNGSMSYRITNLNAPRPVSTQAGVEAPQVVQRLVEVSEPEDYSPALGGST